MQVQKQAMCNSRTMRHRRLAEWRSLTKASAWMNVCDRSGFNPSRKTLIAPRVSYDIRSIFAYKIRPIQLGSEKSCEKIHTRLRIHNEPMGYLSSRLFPSPRSAIHRDAGITSYRLTDPRSHGIVSIYASRLLGTRTVITPRHNKSSTLGCHRD